MKSRWLSLLTLLVAFATLSNAQTQTITGTVTDAQNAVIANATVTALHVETGTPITGATSSAGNYTLTNLPIGVFTVTIEAKGFKSYRRENVQLAAAQTIRVNATLDVGVSTESVTVTAESTMMSYDSGAK